MSNLIANWSAPANISALSTSRMNGTSLFPFASNNLALHVGDDVDRVQTNRRALKDALQLPSEPSWLTQIHSNICVRLEEDENKEADAVVTRDPSRVLAIMTADCLPILICDRQGTEIAAIHAGWRGLVNGIIEQTLQKLSSSADQYLAWIGPAICQQCYATGEEVYQAYYQRYPQFSKLVVEKEDATYEDLSTLSTQQCSSVVEFYKRAERWYPNLSLIAERILQHNGVSLVFQSNVCTFEQVDRFYSYRRAEQTGRIVSLIWFNQTGPSI